MPTEVELQTTLISTITMDTSYNNKELILTNMTTTLLSLPVTNYTTRQSAVMIFTGNANSILITAPFSLPPPPLLPPTPLLLLMHIQITSAMSGPTTPTTAHRGREQR
jgi:hypothetical protein